MDDLEVRRLHTELLLDLQRIRHLADRRTAELLNRQELPVTPAQANVLLALVQNRGPMTARQLASVLELSEVTVGRFVRRLARDGWIERSRDPADARALLLLPTPRAREALPGFIRVSNAFSDQLLEGFDTDSVRSLLVVTGRLCSNLA